jgi:uridine kinase
MDVAALANLHFQNNWLANAMQPELRDLIDIKILTELHDMTRRQRLLDREGLDFMENWHSIWDEAENYYFTLISPPSMFDYIV